VAIIRIGHAIAAANRSVYLVAIAVGVQVTLFAIVLIAAYDACTNE
jgi:hypothetical protein